MDNSQLIKEYYRLCKLSDPSEVDINRIDEIIVLSESNSDLRFLLDQADSLICYENTGVYPDE